MTAQVIATASAGHGGSWVPFVVIPFMVICFALSIYRMRRGGPGPAVGYVPKRLRGRLNMAFRQAEWQEPYDDDGRRDGSRTEV